MRIVVTGATGNVGTALLKRLRETMAVSSVAGVVRRVPPRDAGLPYRGIEWRRIDVGAPNAADRLVEAFAGADTVVHLAWAIQPSHRPEVLARTNLTGSRNVFGAARTAGVHHLVHASSVGSYAAAPADGSPVDETWPATGVPGSLYSQQKAAVEALLDELESQADAPIVTRLRPALTGQRDAGGQLARYFLGPLAPVSLLRFGRVPIMPLPKQVCLQFVHADDVADAYVRVILDAIPGVFNVAAEPAFSADNLARHLGGRLAPTPQGLLRGVARTTWRSRLQPTEPGFVDLLTALPLMDCHRAHMGLGWRARYTAAQVLNEVTIGLAHGCGTGSPVLRPREPLLRRLGSLTAQSSRP